MMANPICNLGTVRRRTWFLLALGCFLLPLADASAAEVEVGVTLIHASNQAGDVDGRLKGVEGLLRRQFKFQSYQQLGAQTARMGLPGEGKAGLPDGFQVTLKAEDAGQGRVRLGVRWSRGDQVLIQTSVVASRGTPVLLGGPSHRGGTAIVALTVK